MLVWMMTLVHWTVAGDVDWTFSLTAFVVGLGMAALVVYPPVPWIGPLVFCVMILTMIAFPFVRAAVNKDQLRRIDLDRLENYYRAIEEKPDNIAARLKVASVLYDRGFVGPAVALADSALDGQRKDFFRDEIRMLEDWKRQVRSPLAFRQLRCLRCGTMCEPSQTHCASCSAPVLLEHARGVWVGSDLARRAVGAWIVLVVMIAAIPAAASALPAWASVPLIVALLMLGVFVGIRAFRPAEKPMS